MNKFFDISEEIHNASKKAMELCADKLKEIDEIQEYNQHRMIKAFQTAKISESHFVGSTGYGYGDRGRDALDEVYSYVFDAEDALVRHNFVSGTHALTVALFGVLRPNDKMLCVTGTPYDTLRSAIGIEGNYSGSLIDFGIKYEEIDLKDNKTVDVDEIKKRLDNSYKMVYIQRSRGYSLRPTLTCDDIENIVKAVREKNKDVIIMLDNCYGEFVEKKQPLSVGVDLMAGSLIKNPGGGIAPTGGYIAGKKDLVEMCSYRLTTPGTGKELGATLNVSRELFLGAYHAPYATGEALKTAIFASALFEILGYKVSPEYNEKSPQVLEKFCVGIQHASAVDSFVTPYPDDMPGYEDKVIMAAGAFTLGSSIELSADAPLREPYAVWMQGSLNFHSGKLGVMLAANEILNDK